LLHYALYICFLRHDITKWPVRWLTNCL
jgi:hypothetical protein